MKPCISLNRYRGHSSRTPSRQTLFDRYPLARNRVDPCLQRNTHFDCIFVVEMLNLGSGIMWNENRHRSRMRGDQAMLVEIAKSIQLPQGMFLRRTRSLIRLKSVDFRRDGIRKTPKNFSIVSSGVTAGEVLINRETDVHPRTRIMANSRQRQFATPFDQDQNEGNREILRGAWPRWDHSVSFAGAARVYRFECHPFE